MNKVKKKIKLHVAVETQLLLIDQLILSHCFLKNSQNRGASFFLERRTKSPLTHLQCIKLLVHQLKYE